MVRIFWSRNATVQRRLVSPLQHQSTRNEQYLMISQDNYRYVCLGHKCASLHSQGWGKKERNNEKEITKKNIGKALQFGEKTRQFRENCSAKTVKFIPQNCFFFSETFEGGVGSKIRTRGSLHFPPCAHVCRGDSYAVEKTLTYGNIFCLRQKKLSYSEVLSWHHLASITRTSCWSN